ncbi:hypothetical protein FS837_009040 [Tulasnella sp. UAMH 9824]|nr:hypothetical protein FS837_009040 [Tulasnella sp. UAMH 9824]
MALRQRTTDHEPPSTPPHSSRGSALTSNAISCPTLYDRLGSSKEVVLALIQSAEAAQELRKTINIVPDLRNLPEDAAKLPSDLIVAVERLVQSLEEVRNKLRSASLNYGREKTGLLGAWGAWDLMMCSHTLRSCQEGVEKALGPVFVRLRRFDSQRDSELGHQGQSDNSTPQRETTAASPQITTRHGRIPHTNSTEDSAAGPGPQGGETLVNSGVLTAARKTFKTVEVLSGTIPIVGNYVGAAAKVGLAVVRMAEKMDENEELAKELGERVITLSKFVGYFEARSEEQRGDELATQINKLKREIGRLRTHVEEWESSGRLMRAFSATEHGEALNAYKKAIDNAFEGMQVLASLNITALVEQLS